MIQMISKSDNSLSIQYITIIFVVLGSSIAYGLSSIIPDSSRALWAFILINGINCVSLFIGNRIIVGGD
jgi:hypothetical protein